MQFFVAFVVNFKMDYEDGSFEVASVKGVSEKNNEENVKAMLDFASFTSNGNVSKDPLSSDNHVSHNFSSGKQYRVMY